MLKETFTLIFPIFPDCQDKYEHCPYWERQGYCKHSYVSFMAVNCKKSCNLCGGGGNGGGSGGNSGSGKCGYKSSTRIVGGTETPKGAWPWQAEINTLDGFTFRGGTLVAP